MALLGNYGGMGFGAGARSFMDAYNQAQNRRERSRRSGLLEQRQNIMDERYQQQQAQQAAQLANQERTRQADLATVQNPQLASMPASAYGDNWAKGAGGGPDLSMTSPSVALAAKKFALEAGEQKPAFGGTGATNQAMNYAITLRPKIDSGTATPQEQAIYNMSVQRLTKPQVYRAPDGSVVEIPGMNIDQIFGGTAQPGQPQQPKSTSDITTLFDPVPEEAKPIPTEKTRMLSLSQSGVSGLDRAEKIIFGDDGSGFNRGVLTTLFGAPAGAISSGMMGEEASQAYSSLLGAVRDKLRLESGAAIPVEEAQEELKRYLPGPFDSAKTAKMKLDSIRAVLNDYQSYGGIGLNVPETKKTEKAPSSDPLNLFGD